MKLLTLLAFIAVGIWLPIAFMEAAQLQAHIDARNSGIARLARLSP